MDRSERAALDEAAMRGRQKEVERRLRAGLRCTDPFAAEAIDPADVTALRSRLYEMESTLAWRLGADRWVELRQRLRSGAPVVDRELRDPETPALAKLWYWLVRLLARSEHKLACVTAARDRGPLVDRIRASLSDARSDGIAKACPADLDRLADAVRTIERLLGVAIDRALGDGVGAHAIEAATRGDGSLVAQARAVDADVHKGRLCCHELVEDWLSLLELHRQLRRRLADADQ